MADERESRGQRRGSAERVEEAGGGSKFVDQSTPHEHKFTSVIKNSKDLPFRHTCELCGFTEPLPADEVPSA